MRERQLYSNIHNQLKKSAAVALLGPRQVGKTTLAHKLSDKLESIYIDLEDPWLGIFKSLTTQVITLINTLTA